MAKVSQCLEQETKSNPSNLLEGLGMKLQLAEQNYNWRKQKQSQYLLSKDKKNASSASNTSSI
jgi:hypothetical protein